MFYLGERRVANHNRRMPAEEPTAYHAEGCAGARRIRIGYMVPHGQWGAELPENWPERC